MYYISLTGYRGSRLTWASHHAEEGRHTSMRHLMASPRSSGHQGHCKHWQLLKPSSLKGERSMASVAKVPQAHATHHTVICPHGPTHSHHQLTPSTAICSHLPTGNGRRTSAGLAGSCWVLLGDFFSSSIFSIYLFSIILLRAKATF
jgi:hypothetical protein